MNHTAGQWGVDSERPDYHGRAVGYYVRSEGGGRIGQVFENCLVTNTAEARANAQLVAAAPDLLAACQRALDWLASYPGGNAEGAWLQARRAVEKATREVFTDFTEPGER